MMVTRRNVLKAMGVAGAGALAPSGLLRAGAAWADEHLPAGVSYDPAPFTLGVASGYPTPGSVTLWTRLAPEPLAADGGLQDPVDVRWAIGTNPEAVTAELGGGGRPLVRGRNDRGRVVARGVTTAVAASAHSVHVEAAGLSPATTYWYGFASDGQVSTIGRTRTAPVGPTSRVRFAVASCQMFGHGWYAAHRHIAEEDLDFVMHLGDYIYADVNGPSRVRSHGDGPSASTLAQYRIRHALYKGDPDLRRAHAMHPWLLMWDDHEVFNNYAGTHVGAQRKQNAYQAYYEHLPIRLTEAGPPAGGAFRIYQQVQFGDLLDMTLLDTRQYRHVFRDPLFPTVHWAEHPDNRLLGEEQKTWLKDLLATETTAWRALGNSVPFTHVFQFGGIPQEGHEVLNDAGVLHFDRVDFGATNDMWVGFGQERYELLKHIHDFGKGDFVNVAGDQHNTIWQHIRLDPDNPLSPIVMPEFAGAPISSNSNPQENSRRLWIYAGSPRVRYYDGTTQGYMVCDVTPERWRTTAWNLRHSQDPDLNPRFDVNATKFESAVFEVRRGDPTLHHVGGEDDPNPFPAD